MISAQKIAIVKSTVPVLQVHGEALTRRFYGILFREHPEVAPFFNPAHQASGTQARALASAVVAYAQHIDRLEALSGAVPTIVHKHVALGVLPEHYPVVGKCLLQAIGEVLGAAATDDIIAAWGEAYGVLAKILIDAEEAVYEANAAKPGGWRGVRPFRVARKERESDVITSFYLQPTDGGRLSEFLPGQYLTIVASIGGKSTRRNYSLSDAPGKAWFRISVKREPGGVFSNWLHDHVEVGHELHVMPPCGELVVGDGSCPVVLATAGVGITPAMAMVEAIAPSGRAMTLIHASRNSGMQAFRPRLEELSARHPNLTVHYVYDAPLPSDTKHPVGTLDGTLLARWIPTMSDIDIFLVGPKPFMQAVFAHATALGVPASRIHYEFFGPKEELVAPT